MGTTITGTSRAHLVFFCFDRAAEKYMAQRAATGRAHHPDRGRRDFSAI